MPTIIRNPDTKRRSNNTRTDVDLTTPEPIQWYEAEIEKNRQSPIPENGLQYSTDRVVQGPASKRPATNCEGRRLRDEWNYGVTYYKP